MGIGEMGIYHFELERGRLRRPCGGPGVEERRSASV